MTTHTSGPWYASASTDNGITVHRDSTGTLLATIRALDVDGAGAANARLIAAAPALLKHLEHLAGACERFAPHILTDEARAAIRAATGSA